MSLDPENDFHPGDMENVILRKILARLPFVIVGGGGGGGGGTLSTDPLLIANSDLLYPSQKAVKTYIDTHDAAVLAAALANDNLYVLKTGDTMTGLLNVNAGVNVPSGQSFLYNNVQVLRAITALDDYFFGNAGNLTMTGINNTGGGFHALNANTSGVNNTAFGVNALSLNTTASQSTAVGAGALQGSTGASNTAVGNQALQGNTTGVTNLAIGDNALRNASTLSDNLAIGFQALFATTTSGSRNLAIGSSALTAATGGDNNLAIGFQALQTKLLGTGNLAVGFRALQVSTGANANTAVGTSAGQALTSGSNNVLFGFQAGNNITTGAKNIVIGHDIDAPVATGSNQMTLGNAIFGVNVDNTGILISAATRIGIKVNTPTASLHLYPGDGAASGAPLKFSAGTNLTTPELGAMEFQDNGTTGHFFGTVNVAGVATRVQLDNDSTTAFVLKAGDTMTGLLQLDGGAKTGTGQIYDFTDNLSIGTNYGSITTAVNNLAIGTNNIPNNNSGNANIGIGTNTLLSLFSGSNNTHIGQDNAAAGNLSTGSNNLILGNDAIVFDGTADNQLNISGCIYGIGLLQDGSFAGSIGIGVIQPTAFLHLKAGTATAEQAPLKFTAGTLLATPEVGALEFTDDGTVAHVYVTIRVATVVTRVQLA